MEKIREFVAKTFDNLTAKFAKLYSQKLCELFKRALNIKPRKKT